MKHVLISAFGAAACAAAPVVGLAQSAQAFPNIGQATARSVSRDLSGLSAAAAALKKAGGVNPETVRLVHVNSYRGRIDARTRAKVGDALGSVLVGQGNGTTYSNAPSPGTLADYLGRYGYTTNAVVGLHVVPGSNSPSVTIYVAGPPDANKKHA